MKYSVMRFFIVFLLFFGVDAWCINIDVVKKAGEDYVAAFNKLTEARTTNKELDKKFKQFAQARDAFKATWQKIPDSHKENFVDVAQQISQTVEGMKEGESGKRIIKWGACWKLPRLQSQPSISSDNTAQATIDDLTTAAKNFVPMHNQIVKEAVFTDVEKATKAFKQSVMQYIQEGGNIGSLLDALKFQDVKVTSKIHEWVCAGIVDVSGA